MKRFSHNTTGLSPVLRNPHPTTKGQNRTKEGTKQEQPWFVQGSKKNNRQLEKQKTNNELQTTAYDNLLLRILLHGTPSLCPKASVRESRNR
jgi:hypothetical protein